jgi:DNA sulfur modification protein DndD
VALTDLEIFRSESNHFGSSQSASDEQRQNRPITFASEAGELRNRIAKESESEQIAAAQQVLGTVKEQITNAISTFKVDGKKLPSTVRSRIIEIIAGILDSSASPEVVPRLHDLSAAERRRLQGWLDGGVGDVAKSARRYAHSIEGLHRQQTSIETQLRKIPAEDQIRPVIEELKTKYQQLARCQQELATVQQEIDQRRNKLADAKRKYDKAADNLSRRAASESRLHIVPKVRAALEEFKSLLILRKVRELEGSVTTSFNLLCRKKDNMRRISIDPNTFAVTVIDRDGHPIPKSQLSAGEKQVYAISMLWALAKTSRRPLPVIIDTPLARLDRDHRHLLAENYFPHASHQVLMLSTDTEVDESYFETISPSISHAYLLEFSPEERFTSVRAGYFWRSKDEAYQVASD